MNLWNLPKKSVGVPKPLAAAAARCPKCNPGWSMAGTRVGRTGLLCELGGEQLGLSSFTLAWSLCKVAGLADARMLSMVKSDVDDAECRCCWCCCCCWPISLRSRKWFWIRWPKYPQPWVPSNMAVVRYAGFVCADMFVFGELPSQIPNPELFVSTICTGVAGDLSDARIVSMGAFW